MARVTDQAVPPELQALYAALTSPRKITQGPDGSIRMKKGKKEPTKKTAADRDVLAWQRLADIVSDELKKATGEPLTPMQKFNLVRSMIVGVFPAEYFRQCPLISVNRFITTPTCTPDPDPPPYGYRPPNFLPTVCNYPNGVPDTGPLDHYGEKEGIYWVDRWLRWNRCIYTAIAFDYPEKHDRVAMRWDVTITIKSGSRGSRPMVSLNLKAQAAPPFGGASISTEPPIMKKSNFYWRFKVPFSPVPYYSASQVRRVNMPMTRLLKKPIDPTSRQYVLNPSPRPMMGKGFNNNDWVKTEINNNPDLFEVRKCMGQNLETWHESAASTTYPWAWIARSELLHMWLCLPNGYQTGNIGRSLNGDTWTIQNTGHNSTWRAVLWVEDLARWVIVADNGTTARCALSPNGITWTAATMPALRPWVCLAWSPSLGRLIAGANSIGVDNIATTTNGTSWSIVATPSGWRINAFCWSPELGIFCGVGNNNTHTLAYTSPDGLNWVAHEIEQYGTLNSIAWSPALRVFMAVRVGESSTNTFTSPDGLEWTASALPANCIAGQVIWAEDLSAFLIAVQVAGSLGNGGGIFITHDLINYIFREVGPATQFPSVAWSEDDCKAIMPNTGPEGADFWISP